MELYLGLESARMTVEVECWKGYPLMCDERRGTQETIAKLLAWARRMFVYRT